MSSRSSPAELVLKVVDDDIASPPDRLEERASQIGAAWAEEYVCVLRAHARAPDGGWPGTMSEARRRVATELAIVLVPDRLQELARVANLAARRGWQEVSSRISRHERGRR